ncbi:hypothetical protein AYL99_08447 [Fonsecaea erecta]|uniref:Uncharacterized protein n=1 Tax=Fonsecaea erecta TaxID=1367422 RepID=A0A178ZD57_9EURO|nr:hypothetical protein AYL99_08447 [Fonsecaea erecta]OAP57709.1 hypothetical protein AYL99_08447 [Fonsecaea erecta]
MDPSHEMSESGRDDNGTRPITPTGTLFSDVGLGMVATPTKVQRPASAASRRSAVDSPKRSSSPSSDREFDHVDRHHQVTSHAIDFSLETVVQQTRLVGVPSNGSHHRPRAPNDENNDVPMDEGGQAQRHTEKDRQEHRNREHTENRFDNILLEAEKLRIDNVALKKELKGLEEYCEKQQREIDVCQEKQIATQRLAENRRREAVDIKRLKGYVDKELAESQAEVRTLEGEIAKLRLQKHKLNDAEWKYMGDMYGELEQKKEEVSSLLNEVQQLRESRELSERARRKSEGQLKKLHGQMKRTFKWIQEAHKQQAQRDMEQFRFHDAHFSSLHRRRPSTSRGSVQTSATQQETLGEFMFSQPQSVTSQSLVSSARQSLASEKALFSKSQTFPSGMTSPLVLGMPPRAPRVPATSQSTSVTSESITGNRMPTTKRVSFHPLQTPSGPQSAPIRRQSDPSLRRSSLKKPSSLRNSMIPGRVYQGEPALVKYYQWSLTPFENDEAPAGRTVAGRSLSMPITQKEHAELRAALHSTTPLRIIWDNSRPPAVSEPEPVTTTVGFVPKPGSQGSLTVKPDHTRESTLHHASIIPGSANHLSRASTDRVRDLLAASEARIVVSPIGPPVSSSVHAVKDGTATSSAIEYPPSPGLRKRQGGISAKTFSIRDLEPTQNSSPSKVPLPCAGQDKTKDAQQTICTSSDSFDQLGRSKCVKGYRCQKSPVRKTTIAMATAISIIMALCSLALLASYTNNSPTRAPVFCTEAREHQASSVPIRARLLCPLFSLGHQGQREIFAKTKTVTDWLADTWISTSTETETLAEIAMQTLRQKQTQTQTQMVFKTQTVTEPSLQAHTEIRTETVTVFVVLSPSPPPTRSFRSRILPSDSEPNRHNQSAAGPVPGATPSLEPDENGHWPCSCPGTSSTPCGKSNATSLSSWQLSRPGGSINPTAPEIDERAKKARQRNLHLQHIYTGPTYLGLVPPIQRLLEILQFKILELLLGGAWGAREY